MTVADNTVPVDLAQVPGAMRDRISRELPGGALLEYEFSPAGYLKKDGQPRLADWRAYFHTPEGVDAKRKRMASVSSLLDAIMPKPGLPPWSEARGIEGAAEAIRRGYVTAETAPEEWVLAVRANHLGADRARDTAAARGINVHSLLEVFSMDGVFPNPADHPVEHHGFIRGLSRWLLKTSPEPESIEQLVCDPEWGFAGRCDLVAVVGGRRVRFDLKTSPEAQIWARAHVQIGLYERAAVACGEEPTDEQRVVVVAEDGRFREMVSEATPDRVRAALEWWRAVRPMDSVCESANRAEKKARRA